ncbi:Histidine utilization repressor [uncultured Stenotrophomonas sp.]|uniref:Histidine utilization repressor n=1 Tax=uncultured Stenotrophomonas sp. TaxID=165438 RepID=A0A1Y5Q1H1_9GAMM|nr:Histidine utilization repressor [uncultured Stenotrophomonas sp.]
MNARVDKDRKKAPSLNQRIRGDIEGRILSGEWMPGFRIPFEHELMAQYGCSRMTVNKVLTALAESGMIERRRRAGSFVARQSPHLEQVALEIPDIALAVGGRGHVYGFRLLERAHRKARAEVAEEVRLVGKNKLLAMRCLHLADGRPLALERRLINPEAVPETLDVDFSRHAPGSWLLQNVSWTRGQHRISAVAADAGEAALLQVPPGTACLVIDRQTWLGEQPITWVRQMFLGDAYDLVARFAPGGGARSE